ncbi:hypothetical protein CVD28_01080 [Bacillus sp. M6-12]|uniref:hypothetical protein n=1 Tax=Bacillus sp. M6-12 TaxID=2054166 RepID=UPI000C7899AF|nr:hypothetical protein [Bacillus sp. M6-12]PLS19027.1 hypothetical protein CVD28_01080 [Bacillus sp. M6-12]
MKLLQSVRNEFFKQTGKTRFKRTIVIAFFLASYWCGIDYFVHHELTMNLWHDISVVVLAIIVERCLPWGKEKINT